MSTPSPAILICGAIRPRLDRLEGALERIARRDDLARITMGFRARDELLVLVLEPAPGAEPGFGPAAAAAARLPGLRALDLAPSGSPDRLRDRALRSCDPVIVVESPKAAAERLRAFLEDPGYAAAPPPPVFPIRFEPESFLEVYKRDLSQGTLFVPWEEEKPAVGSNVRLDLFVPGDPSPVKALAKVIHHGDVAGPGFGTRVALSEVARERLELTSRRLQASASSREIRNEPRVPARLEVAFSTGSEVGRAWTQDISRGGVFVATENPPALGTAVELTLALPGGDAVKLPAEVVRLIGPEESAAKGFQQGCGLTFHDVSPEVRRRLEAFVEAVEIAPMARVLLVDDAALYRSLLGDELASRGCEVVEATNGAEAFEKLVDELFALDLLVLDLVLPNTSGVELLDRIRRLGGETELVIAVVAGGADDPGVRRRVLEAGANEVMAKSMPVKEVADRLLALLPKR
ncbi:MAG TPA: TIGR02266 family protein [Vulgatibacter sp.]|nr:TIGR02266 family protein [Vulgatibacter sp.]